MNSFWGSDLSAPRQRYGSRIVGREGAFVSIFGRFSDPQKVVTRYVAVATPLSFTGNVKGRGNEHYPCNIRHHRFCGLLDLGFLGLPQRDLPHNHACLLRCRLDGHQCFWNRGSRQQSHPPHGFQIALNAPEEIKSRNSPENVERSYSQCWGQSTD